MEVRHRCCEAIYRAFTLSTKLMGDPAFADMASKVRSSVLLLAKLLLILNRCLVKSEMEYVSRMK